MTATDANGGLAVSAPVEILVAPVAQNGHFYIWTGADFANNLAWNNPANWSPSTAAPGPKDNAIILQGPNVNLTSPVTVNNLWLPAAH